MKKTAEEHRIEMLEMEIKRIRVAILRLAAMALHHKDGPCLACELNSNADAIEKDMES